MPSSSREPAGSDYQVPHLRGGSTLEQMRADGRLALVSDDARCPYCRSRFIVPNSGMLVNPEDPQGMRLYQCASCRRIYRSLAHLRKEHLDTTEWVMLVLVVMLVLGCGWIWFIG